MLFSSNGAENWRKVSVPDVGVHFGSPSPPPRTTAACAWLVPGRADNQRMAIDGAACSSPADDGGAGRWHQLGESPQESACDLVYRHALDNRDGIVVFGSTTGNLYLSEDRGEPPGPPSATTSRRSTRCASAEP